MRLAGAGLGEGTGGGGGYNPVSGTTEPLQEGNNTPPKLEGSLSRSNRMSPPQGMNAVPYAIPWMASTLKGVRRRWTAGHRLGGRGRG